MKMYILVLFIICIPIFLRAISFLIALRKLRFCERKSEIVNREVLAEIDQKVLSLGIEILRQNGFEEWFFARSNIPGYDKNYLQSIAVLKGTIKSVEMYAYINQTLQPNHNECPLSIDLYTFLDNKKIIVSSQTGNNLMLTPIESIDLYLQRTDVKTLIYSHIERTESNNGAVCNEIQTPAAFEEQLNELYTSWTNTLKQKNYLTELESGTYIYSITGVIRALKRGLTLKKQYNAAKGKLLEDTDGLMADPESIEKLIVFNQMFEDTPCYFSKKETIFLFVFSLVAAALSFKILQYDFNTLAIILAIIFVHETGHALGMMLFGYKNVKFFFLPFFGGFAVGKKPENNPSGEILMLLLGPVPGIIISCLIYGLQDTLLLEKNGLLLTYAELSLYINIFNLLPVDPLDGGKICNLLLFSRFPKLQTFFLFLSGIILVLTFNPLLLPIGLCFVCNLNNQWKSNHLIQKIRKQGDTRIASSCSTISKAFTPQKTSSRQRLIIMKNIISQSRVKPISFHKSVILLGIYIGAMIIIPGITMINMTMDSMLAESAYLLVAKQSPRIEISQMKMSDSSILIFGDLPL